MFTKFLSSIWISFSFEPSSRRKAEKTIDILEVVSWRLFHVMFNIIYSRQDMPLFWDVADVRWPEFLGRPGFHLPVDPVVRKIPAFLPASILDHFLFHSPLFPESCSLRHQQQKSLQAIVDHVAWNRHSPDHPVPGCSTDWWCAVRFHIIGVPGHFVPYSNLYIFHFHFF